MQVGRRRGGEGAWPRSCQSWPQHSMKGSVRNEDLGILLGLTRPTALVFSWAAGATCGIAERSSSFLPASQARQGAGWMRGASSSGAVGSAHDPSGLHGAAQPVGATPVAEGGERAQAWPQCIQLVSEQQPQQQQCTQSILDIPNAQSTPTQLQSASPGTARFFVSSPAVAMPNELGFCTSQRRA